MYIRNKRKSPSRIKRMPTAVVVRCSVAWQHVKGFQKKITDHTFCESTQQRQNQRQGTGSMTETSRAPGESYMLEDPENTRPFHEVPSKAVQSPVPPNMKRIIGHWLPKIKFVRRGQPRAQRVLTSVVLDVRPRCEFGPKVTSFQTPP